MPPPDELRRPILDHVKGADGLRRPILDHVQGPEGPADVLLENDRVVVDAPFLLLKGNRKEIGSDFDIDNLGRRTEHTNPRRRALVHDFEDRLTLNWGKDYPGGVRILGELSVPDHLLAGKIETGGLLVRHTATGSQVAEPGPANPSKLQPRRQGGEGMTALTVTFDVGEELAGLRKRVADLEGAIAGIRESLKGK